MQLTSVGYPILLTTALLSPASAFSFSYNDLDNYSNINAVIQNNETARYIKDIESNSYNHLILGFKFQGHLNNWKSKTMFFSSVDEIINDVDFQIIVEMGRSVVPLILSEIDKNPSLLVWALNIIYDKKISQNPNTTIEEACKLWIKRMTR